MKERGDTDRFTSLTEAGESLLQMCECAGIDGPGVEKLRKVVEEMQQAIKLDGIAEQNRIAAKNLAYRHRWLPIFLAAFNLGMSIGYSLQHRWRLAGLFLFITAVGCWMAKRGAAISRELIELSDQQVKR